MKRTLRIHLQLVFATLAISVSLCPAQATPFDYSGPSMSGTAVNALVSAFAAAGFDSKVPPPLALQGYIVTIDRAAGEFEVTFSGEVTAERRELVVSPGKVGTPSPESTAEPVDGVLLPGVVAGAIIMVHQEILKDKGGYVAGKVPSGAYNVLYYSEAGATYEGFVSLNAPPSVTSTKSAPTPTPRDGMRCLAGDCDYRVGYVVTYRGGQARLREIKLI